MRNKGITLIALVITIIVLLILAGITIGALTGENGILTQVSKAKEETIIAREKEAINLAFSDCKIENLGTTVECDKLEESLLNNGENVFVTGYENVIITFKETNHRYTLNQDGGLARIEDLTAEELNKIVKVIANGVVLTATDNVNFIGRIERRSNGIEFIDTSDFVTITNKGIKQLKENYFLDKDGKLYNLESEIPERVKNLNGIDLTNKKLEKI